MTVVRLPDGSERCFDHVVKVLDVAAAIGPGLARAAIAGKINGKAVDLDSPIERDCELAIITEKDPEELKLFGIPVHIYWRMLLKNYSRMRRLPSAP